ncbi:hypothetical protein JDV02_006653 [Purpureocillium takamizusanense]|nr:uncharacterized protein JDV02_006653 [Purpureocillium takamizusanense]UNI20579.1 hypothetical protein JDV02_006653 [Purpureocillium takamizusanense]
MSDPVPEGQGDGGQAPDCPVRACRLCLPQRFQYEWDVAEAKMELASQTVDRYNACWSAPTGGPDHLDPDDKDKRLREIGALLVAQLRDAMEAARRCWATREMLLDMERAWRENDDDDDIDVGHDVLLLGDDGQ